MNTSLNLATHGHLAARDSLTLATVGHLLDSEVVVPQKRGGGLIAPIRQDIIVEDTAAVAPAIAFAYGQTAYAVADALAGHFDLQGGAQVELMPAIALALARRPSAVGGTVAEIAGGITIAMAGRVHAHGITNPTIEEIIALLDDE